MKKPGDEKYIYYFSQISKKQRDILKKERVGGRIVLKLVLNI
jgi:hypothetical protein